MAGTGAAVPSDAILDLKENAKTLDEFVSSGSDFVVGRTTPSFPSGKNIRTLTGINAVFDAAQAGQFVADSEAAADRAETAADVAMTAGWVYATVAEGEAARVDGDYFWVVSAEDSEVLELWLMGATTATDTGKRTVAKPYVDAVEKKVETLKSNLVGAGQYPGIGSDVPIVTDSELRIILGYNKETNKLFGAGVGDAAVNTQIDDKLAGYQFAEFTSTTGVYPVLTDKQGRVLLGYDDNNKRIVAAGLSDSSASGAEGFESLDSPIEQAAINHVISYGQSLSVGAQGKPIISTSQPYSNLTFQGGPRAYDGTAYLWSPFKALVEDDVAPAPDGSTTRGETICSGAANYATTLRAIEGFSPDSHVVLATAAGYGGYRIDQLNKGTSWYNNTFLSHITEAHAINADHAVHAVFWLQGENDGAASTPYASYLADLLQLAVDIDADAKAITGQTSPVYLLTYQTCTRSAQWRQVQQAQLDAAKQGNSIFMVTPLYHIEHSSDDVHLTAKGYKHAGAYFGRSYKTVVDGNKPKWLNPISATKRGTEIRVRFDVPHKPLVLDTTTLANTTDYGFAVEDAAGIMTITDVTIDGDDVILTVSAEPSGGVTVRYAMDYLGYGLTINLAGSGNLRDSEPSTITVSGEDLPLYNVAPHFELNVITLGE